MDRTDKYELSRNQSRKIRFNNETGINRPYALGGGGVGISGQGYTVRGAMRTTSSGQEFRQPKGGPNYDRDLARAKAKLVLREMQSLPTPKLG